MQSHKQVAGLIWASALLVTVAASAQSNPSADQIIQSLKPGAGMLGGTRGIRPVGPSAEPQAAAPNAAPAAEPGARASSVAAHPAPAKRLAAPPASPTGAAPSVNLTVEFPSNSAVVTAAAARSLGELGRALASPALASYRFRIEGHTDTVGSAEANKALSERRAQAVVAFLAERFQIDRNRLQPEGMGEDGLLVQTPPQTPELRNRRVQIVNLGA